MAPNFSKNAILTGYVDYFCLICEIYLKNEDETISHIAKETHINKLEATTYVDDFKEDYIKKINSKYFCELCNKLLPVLAKVRIHVSEPLHLDIKKHNVLRKKDNIVIAFDKMVINEQSWHGLYENSCAICNLEYDNKDEHTNNISHILKLIQIKVELVENKHLYRKIDETTFQCLTCNIVSSINNLRAHFNENEHKKKYQECCEQFQNLVEVKLDDTILEKPIKQQCKNESQVKDKQKKIIKLNTEIASNKCDIVAKEEKGQKKVLNKGIIKCTVDEISDEQICKVLNATNYITYDENGQCWCILCNWVMSPSKVVEHGKGKHHQTILKCHKKRIEQSKNMKNALKSPETVNGDIVQNSAILLDFVDEFQKQNININFESNTATCKKCGNTLELNYDFINNHIKEHRKIGKKQNKKMPFHSGKVNVSESKNMLFTSPVHIKQDNQETHIEKICDKTNDDSKINITPSTNIKNNVSEKLPRPVQSVKKHKKVTLKKTLLVDFIVSLTAVESIIFQDFIINNKFVINMFSMVCFVKTNNVVECVMCEENVIEAEFKQHLECCNHERKTHEIFLITEIDSEFIREIRENKFHCGFCNTVETSWEDMLVHVKTMSHRGAKMFAEERLAQYKENMAFEKAIEAETLDKLHFNMLSRFLKLT